MDFVAAPSVHLGKEFEIDVSAFEEADAVGSERTASAVGGGVATTAPPQPTLPLETALPE